MVGKSKQEIESKINEAMAIFLKEQMVEEAQEVITQVVGDTIIVRFKGVLTPAERQLCKDPDGAKLINELKGKLIEKAKPLLEPLIENLTEAKVVDMHFSFNVQTGERIEIFTLNKDLEKSCQI
jgi:uncharacterized protein YbcI